MKKIPLFLAACFLAANAWSQEVIIKGILRCSNNGVTSTRGAVNIVIIPSFNPLASVATTTSPEGFFQINTGWDAKELRDKNVALYIITKCKDCKTLQRIFITEDLDKRNFDPTKMYVTVKGWKLLKNCTDAELPDLLSERLLDSAQHLPPEPISAKKTGSSALGPVSFLNLLGKLLTVAASSQGAGMYKLKSIPPGRIKYGIFLHSSPITNTNNTGFNFAPYRNLSEAIYWNASAIGYSSKPNNVSLLANYRNNIKLSGYTQIAKQWYVGLGGIYTRQDEFRKVEFASVINVDNTTNQGHTDMLSEYAAFIAPVYVINQRMNVGVTIKSVWQQFNNPMFMALEQDNDGVFHNFFRDDSVMKHNIDADLSFSYKVNNSIQAGVSIMNVADSKLYADMFVPDSANQKYVHQRAYGAGISYKHGRFNAGVDALFTDDGFFDASVGVNYVPFNDGLIAAGYAFKQKSFSVSFRVKHFRISYVDDNGLVRNDTRSSKTKIFNGKIYSGFVFDF